MCSDFYLSSNFEKKNYAPEEIIEFFFDKVIEQHVKLKDIPKYTEKKTVFKDSPNNVEFNFKPSLRPLFSFNFFITLGLSISYCILAFKEPTFPKWVLLFFAFTWPIPIIVHLSYYLKNAGAKIIIDKKNHDLTFIKGSKTIKFNRNDIFRCQVTFSKSSRMSMCDDYSYVWFILNNRTYIIITQFIAPPNEIVKTLNCKHEEKAATAFLPLI